MARPSIPTFYIYIERKKDKLTLAVPCTLKHQARYQRLLDFLTKENWRVRPAACGPAMMAGGWGGATEEQAQAAELLFVRDCLCPLRAKRGCLPEKMAAKLLEIGVKALHKRCLELFGLEWGDFLTAGCAAAAPHPGLIPTAAAAAQQAAPDLLSAAAPVPASAVAAAVLLPDVPMEAHAGAAAWKEEAGQECLLHLFVGRYGDGNGGMDWAGAATTTGTTTGCGEQYEDWESCLFDLGMGAAVELSMPPTPSSAPVPSAAPAAPMLPPTPLAAEVDGGAAAAPGGDPGTFFPELVDELEEPLSQLISPPRAPAPMAATQAPIGLGASPSYESLLSLDVPDVPWLHNADLASFYNAAGISPGSAAFH